MVFGTLYRFDVYYVRLGTGLVLHVLSHQHLRPAHIIYTVSFPITTELQCFFLGSCIATSMSRAIVIA